MKRKNFFNKKIKTNYMKKNTTLLTLIMLVFSLTSFAQINSDILSKDENFKTFVISFQQITNNLSQKFNKTERQNITLQIENAQKENMTTGEQSKFVTNIFNFSNESEYLAVQNILLENLKKIQLKFGEKIDKNIYIEATKKVNENNQHSFAPGCGWRFALCSAAVGVEGALMLAACSAVTGGVAAPLCLAGALIWGANGVADCRESHCSS
jgi:hypothetical protein